MSSLSPSIQSVVQLFRGPLASVRFGEIDAAGINQLATEVEGVAAEVEAQEAKVAELKQTLSQRQESLLQLAQQALAYARIYAEGDDALTAELSQISLPRPAKPRKKEAPTQPVAESESAAVEAAPESAEVVVERSTEVEADAAEEAPVAVNRRARGRAKTGTART